MQIDRLRRLFRVENASSGQLTVHLADGGEMTYTDRSENDWDVGSWYFVEQIRKMDEEWLIPEGAEAEFRGEDGCVDDWVHVSNSRGQRLGTQTAPVTNNPTQDTSPIGGQSNRSVDQSKHHLTSTQSMDANAASADAGQSLNNVHQADTLGASPPAEETLGMAVGGEKDFGNFRQNVAEGFAPKPAAVSVEGLFYDYYFDTGETSPKNDALFYPSYSRAVTRHPISRDIEHYLTVGLNSNIPEEEFERKALNLVVVVDVSGSMTSPFPEYYYDGRGEKQPVEDRSEVSKIEAAKQALTGLTRQLDDDDQLGVVLYHSDSELAKPLRDVDETDMDAIRDHIDEINANGSTNLSAGFQQAVDMLADEAADSDATEAENRVIFLTDEMPNTGETDVDSLVDDFQSAADDGIHTTFVGVGLDTNVELGDAIGNIRGANHYFVHSPDEFTRRLDDEFEYMVTPLVYDLSLELEADGFEVEDVYGAPSTDEQQLMHVSTLFPSPTKEGDARGGVILVKVRRIGDDPRMTLKASWELRDGSTQADVVTPDFGDPEPEFFGNGGIEKAVALARYADLLDEMTAESESQSADLEASSSALSELSIDPDTTRVMREYIEEVARRVDDDLMQEVEVLDAIESEHADAEDS